MTQKLSRKEMLRQMVVIAITCVFWHPVSPEPANRGSGSRPEFCKRPKILSPNFSRVYSIQSSQKPTNDCGDNNKQIKTKQQTTNKTKRSYTWFSFLILGISWVSASCALQYPCWNSLAVAVVKKTNHSKQFWLRLEYRAHPWAMTPMVSADNVTSVLGN